MGKISDIWVKLGLKKDDFDEGMEEAQEQVEGFGGKLGKMKAGALAVWAAISAAVTKFAQDLIASSNKMGDAWAVFTSQSKAKWDTFMSAISAWDFENFFGRMKQAAAEAAEFTKALDSEFEVGNSIKLQRAAMSSELAALKVIMQDATKTFDERIKAGQDYIAKIEPIYKQIEAQAKRMEDAHLGKWLSGTGLEDTDQVRKDLRQFLVDIGKFPELYDELAGLSKYEELAAGAKTDISKTALGQAVESRRAIIEGMVGDYATDILDLFRVYNDMRGDKDTAPLVEAMIAYGEAAAAFDRETGEIKSVTSGLIQQKTTTAAAEAAKQVTLEGVVQDIIANIEEDLKGIEDITLEAPEINTTSLEAGEEKIKQFVDTWREEQQKIAELNGMLEDSIVSSMSNGLQAVTDMLVGLEGANAGAIAGALLQPFADTAIKLGEMLIAQGIGVEAFKKSLESLQGAAAIAAGTALVAVGSAMRSGIQALASGGGSASTAAYTGASTSARVQNYESTLTVYVEGKLKGSDIVLSGNKTVKNWGR